MVKAIIINCDESDLGRKVCMGLCVYASGGFKK